MYNWDEIKEAMLEYDEPAAVMLLKKTDLSQVEMVCQFLEGH